MRDCCQVVWQSQCKVHECWCLFLTGNGEPVSAQPSSAVARKRAHRAAGDDAFQKAMFEEVRACLLSCCQLVTCMHSANFPIPPSDRPLPLGTARLEAAQCVADVSVA